MMSRKVAVVETACRTSEGGQVTGAIQWDAVLIWYPLHRQMCKAITSSHYLLFETIIQKCTGHRIS